MQSEAEDDEMIRINKRKFFIAAMVILLTGILIGQQMVQAKSDTYEDLKNFTQALEKTRRGLLARMSVPGTAPEVAR